MSQMRLSYVASSRLSQMRFLQGKGSDKCFEGKKEEIISDV